MFDTPYMILTGLATGLFFGFVLQKAGVTRYSTIVGQFLFADNTVLKVMLTAIVVGAIGVYGMLDAGWIKGLHVKPALLGATVVGGLIFGVGMTVLGYCPGTCAAALGEGSRHALPGLLGMIVGAGLYAETMPYLQSNVLAAFAYGKLTFESLTGLSHWVFIAGLGAFATGLFVLLERKSCPLCAKTT